MRDRRLGNAKFHGTAQLNWSLVEEVKDTHLALLIQGLDAEAITELGGDSLSEKLANRLLAILGMPPEKPPSSSKSVKSSSQGKLFQEKLVPAQPNNKSGQSELLDTEFIPAQNTDPEKENSVLASKVLSPNQIRDRLVTMIYKDLLGPTGGEFEEVDEPSLTERYLVGAIAPRKRSQKSTEIKEDDPAQQDSLAATGKKSNDDGDSEDIAPPSSLFPYSLGLSFCVDGQASEIQIHAQWGRYEREESKSITTEAGNPKTVWVRTPMEARKVFSLQERTEKSDWVPCPQDAPEVVVTLKSRRLKDDWIVTVFLENRQLEPEKNRDGAWLFQPELKITSPDKTSIFVRKPLPASTKLDDSVRFEQQSLQLLYRNIQEFAVGHNTSIHTDVDPQDKTRAHCLKTSVIPRYEVPQTTPPDEIEIPGLKGLILDMKVLAKVEPEALPPILYPLVTAYEQWLGEQQQLTTQLPSDPPSYRSAAANNLGNCQQALERIRAGIELLETNAQAVEAFQFMNGAMAKQRVRGMYAEQIRQGKKVTLDSLDQEKNHSWRTFQLAFILINLPSLTDLHHPDRHGDRQGLCDLLWFPTGGGKTEAYLGLTAYTLAIRRLQGTVAGHDGEHGIAVLMRYTLRLLTLQQFQRATTLICACEDLRRENPKKWGQEPFRIGLWVGNNSTPNWTKQSEEVIKQEKGQGYSGNTGTPHQLTNCPWCGTEINAGRDIEVKSFEKDQGRTLVYCGDKLGKCLFSRKKSPHEGLPIITVDEEIYRRLPALVIATVDKFAQMPWNGKIQMLFGKVNGYCDRHGFRCPDLEDSDSHPKTSKLPAAKTRPHPSLRPPDLIIQDELHLISGPLGSLVGLYETAIDALCTWEVEGKNVRPKIVASTATIRQAPIQVHHLFARKLAIFPPQAIAIEDNFFSRQRPPGEDYPGRLYLGICAPSRRLKAALIRVYLVALSAAQQLMDEGYNADAWMTLVGYFNSLRELGGTRRLVDDDITTCLSKMDERGLAKRYLNRIEELTSRKSSTDIPKILDALEQPFEVKSLTVTKDQKSQGQSRQKSRPLDVILATNMISVGVDVRRLGLMVACGQPKNTAEYPSFINLGRRRIECIP
ncbi:DISARM system helicase DrmA [Synechocystis sp. PCC 7338]|uniref:DISARM system helicase DrmA n=1 Tax=Synechocystis sp. PCC 7338 TaxID=2732530 RepID=UPI001BAF242F|nr:DISARM system helicase DrmA [Synechocystis sp. PCC 7338]QUS60718.1 helicase [Synechocystis sp. PCC 7338]